MRHFIVIAILLALIPLRQSYADDSSQFSNCEEFYAFEKSSYENVISKYGNDAEARQIQMSALGLILISEAYKCRTHCESMKLMAIINIEAFKNKKALQYAMAAVSANPSDSEANNILGTIFGLSGNYQEGLPYLKKAASLDSKYQHDLCTNYEMAEQYEEAISACSQTIGSAINENLVASAYYVRGRAHRALNETEKAKADFAKAKNMGFNGEQFYSPEHLGK